MSESKSTHPITRRSFAAGAVAAAAAVLAPGGSLQAQSAAPSQAEAEAMNKLSSSARAEVEAKISEIFRKYGSRLSDQQKSDIRKAMADTQDGLEKMRSYVLANGDQPASALRLLYKGEEI